MSELIKKDEVCIDTINITTKSISVVKYELIIEDGKEISRSVKSRMAFVAGDIEKFKDFTGMVDSPEIGYLNAIWTEDLISEQQELKE